MVVVVVVVVVGIRCFRSGVHSREIAYNNYAKEKLSCSDDQV